MTDILDQPAIPPPSPSELDELISRDPLELSAQDIDKIIAYQRQQRARREAGNGKTKRTKAEPQETVTLDLSKLGLIKAQPAPAPTSVPAVVSSFKRRM